ncbi:MAG: xanthine dehydrogenase family protein molybdopterin-binding subunit, partial [Geminicoccaceae bacterium]|nr:xanthine dehydrogenase family protein molybdopterin-binding subunit [Geminicoccaceae bacterium]
MQFGIGQPVRREEDPRFITGKGRYTDDHVPDGVVPAVFLRAPLARARIRSIDASAAQALPGVIRVFTGADTTALGPMPILVPKLRQLERPDGQPMPIPDRLAIARDRVAHLGEIVAMVVAETTATARDAIELIELDLDEEQGAPTLASALRQGAPAVWDSAADNVAFRVQMGDEAAVEAALGQAAHVSTVEIPVSRLAMNPMEPRGALGEY